MLGGQWWSQSKGSDTQLKSAFSLGPIHSSLCFGEVPLTQWDTMKATGAASGPAGTAADEVYLSGEPMGEDGPRGRLQTDALAPCPGGKWVRTPASTAQAWQRFQWEPPPSCVLHQPHFLGQVPWALKPVYMAVKWEQQ